MMIMNFIIIYNDHNIKIKIHKNSMVTIRPCKINGIIIAWCQLDHAASSYFFTVLCPLSQES